MNYFYKDRDWYYFGFPFNKRLMIICKSFGCQYNTENREWYLQVNDASLCFIQKFIEDYHFKEVHCDEVKRPNQISLKSFPEMLSKQDIIYLMPDLNLKKQPRTYQIDTIHYLVNHGNCINGSGIGTGKTLSSIFFCELLDTFPCIVVAPNSVKRGWEKEWRECNPERSISILSSGKKNQDFTTDVIIINYDLLGIKKGKEICLRFPELQNLDIKALIGDEIHFLKNEKSVRSKAFKKLADKSGVVLGLSGSLIMNRPNELVNILRVINRLKDIAPNIHKFYRRYCNQKVTRFGNDVKGAVNIKELHNLLKHYCYFRIEKKDALQDLPPTQEQYIECDINNKKLYKEAEKNFIEFLELADEEKVDSALRAKQLVEVAYLKQLALDGKKKAIEEFITDWIEGNEEEKLIVFGVHVEALTGLSKRFKNSVLITGDVKQKEKENRIERFKTDSECQLMFANMQCIGTGVDGLQEVCSCIALIEFPQKPEELSQVIGRVERSGQKNSINIYYLLNKDTIDGRLWEMLQKKKEVTDIVNKGYLDDTSLMLINSFKKK